MNFDLEFVLKVIMRSSKIHYFLFLAVFMLAAKPFIGFDAMKHFSNVQCPGIIMKAFTKRKQEYVEGSSFDISTINKRLADPLLALTLLFPALLNIFFPYIFRKSRQVTAGFLSDIHLSLFPPLHRYLLSGKLII
jgi:hypothetical protein